MKRILSLVVSLCASVPFLIQAADGFDQTAAMVAQRDAEERYKRLTAEIQMLQENQETLLRRNQELRQQLSKLSEEVRALKDDQGRSSGKYVTREEWRSYMERMVREIDEKREADKKLILDNIKQLAKAPVSAPEPRSSSRRTPDPATDDAFIYVIQEKDRLLDIIAAYNEKFKEKGMGKITLEQVVRANPGLKPDLLIPGKKLRIPEPR